MTCTEVADWIEPVAAGDVRPPADIAAHLETCASCRAALASATELDRWLRERPAASAPRDFAARTLARIGRERWRTEQRVDLAFNIGLALIFAAVVVGAWLLVSSAGLVSYASLAQNAQSAIALLGSGLVTLGRRAVPSLPVYIAAAAILSSVLVVWWWAENAI
jgi:predicted anti-sigma-YlaC factor YlaD